MEHLISKYLNDDELLRISAKIFDTEKITSGEIVISIKEKKNFFEKNKNINELAIQEFKRLKINHTKENTGILIFMILEEKEFYILADESIHNKVEKKIWDEVKDKMINQIKEGEFCNALLLGVEEVGKILSLYFPYKSGDRNEISNRVVIS